MPLVARAANGQSRATPPSHAKEERIKSRSTPSIYSGWSEATSSGYVEGQWRCSLLLLLLFLLLFGFSYSFSFTFSNAPA